MIGKGDVSNSAPSLLMFWVKGVKELAYHE